MFLIFFFLISSFASADDFNLNQAVGGSVSCDKACPPKSSLNESTTVLSPNNPLKTINPCDNLWEYACDSGIQEKVNSSNPNFVNKLNKILDEEVIKFKPAKDFEKKLKSNGDSLFKLARVTTINNYEELFKKGRGATVEHINKFWFSKNHLYDDSNKTEFESFKKQINYSKITDEEFFTEIRKKINLIYESGIDNKTQYNNDFVKTIKGRINSEIITNKVRHDVKANHELMLKTASQIFSDLGVVVDVTDPIFVVKPVLAIDNSLFLKQIREAVTVKNAEHDIYKSELVLYGRILEDEYLAYRAIAHEYGHFLFDAYRSKLDKLVSCLTAEAKLNKNQVLEAMADWFSFELFAKYLESKNPKLSDEEAKAAIARAAVVSCRPLLNYNSTNEHPRPDVRANNIMLVQPGIQKILGCKVSAQRYCSGK